MHTTQNQLMHIRNTKVFMMCYLPLELVKKTLPSQKGTLLSVQSIHGKHNNRVNKHTNK